MLSWIAWPFQDGVYSGGRNLLLKEQTQSCKTWHPLRREARKKMVDAFLGSVPIHLGSYEIDCDIGEANTTCLNLFSLLKIPAKAWPGIHTEHAWCLEIVYCYYKYSQDNCFSTELFHLQISCVLQKCVWNSSDSNALIWASWHFIVFQVSYIRSCIQNIICINKQVLWQIVAILKYTFYLHCTKVQI